MPLSDDSGICCLSTLLGPPSTSGGTAGVRLFEPDDISCIMRVPRLCAWLTEDSVLRVWFEGDGPELVCLVIKETYVGPVCRQWNVCLFD